MKLRIWYCVPIGDRHARLSSGQWHRQSQQRLVCFCGLHLVIPVIRWFCVRWFDRLDAAQAGFMKTRQERFLTSQDALVVRRHDVPGVCVSIRSREGWRAILRARPACCVWVSRKYYLCSIEEVSRAGWHAVRLDHFQAGLLRSRSNSCEARSALALLRASDHPASVFARNE